MKIIQNKYGLIYLFIICVYRTKLVVGDTTYAATDVTTELPTTESLSGIYVITGYSSLSTTIGTTQYTSQVSIVSSTTNPTTYYPSNGTFIITGFSFNGTSTTTIITTTTTTTTVSTTTATTFSTTTTTTALPSNYCRNDTHVLGSNGTCLLIQTLINSSVDIISNSSANATDRVDAIAIYLRAVANLNTTSNLTNTLTLGALDQTLGNLSVPVYERLTNESAIVVTRPNPCSNDTTIIGNSYLKDVPTVLDTINTRNITDSPVSAAGYVNFTSDCRVNIFNMLIINNPSIYQNIDNSSNKTVVSSIIMGQIGSESPYPINTSINLYFQVLDRSKTDQNGNLTCSFYNTTTLQWSTDGCSAAKYNSLLDRYECQCNHLTSFALIWLPKPPLPPSQNSPRPELNSQDKASIAFQSISIVCFLGIIVHAIVVRLLPNTSYSTIKNLLSVSSYGITMLLFIFYITLGAVVFSRRTGDYDNNRTYTQKMGTSEGNFNGKNLPFEPMSRAGNPDANLTSRIPCLPTELGLMFVVYFFIIFMFCSKTAIGIFNYLHFVRLFPPPPKRILIIGLIISFVISVIWLVFGVGFNSRPSNEITEVFADKICWFKKQENHYFLTIPISIFLVVNLSLFIPVAVTNINRGKPTEEKEIKNYKRRRNSIYIILTSSATQGFGWLFGIVIAFTNDNVTAANVLGWFFVIFNGLEGLWILILYMIVEKEGIDETPLDKDNKYLKDLETFGKQIDPMNIELDDRRREPLTAMISESPRNSFADISKI